MLKFFVTPCLPTRPPQTMMQIFVKTLNFGTVSLQVEASDTIGDVKKMVRDKLDTQFTGFDVEVMVATENQLSFEGKLLDDDLNLSDYHIQEEANLRTVFNLDGSGPGLIKKHLKKNEAIEQVNSKTKAGIAKDLRS